MVELFRSSSRSPSTDPDAHKVGGSGRSRLPNSLSISPTKVRGAEEDDCMISLSEAQMKVVERIMARKSCFFTGAAGTGKSFCVSVLQSVLAKLGKTGIISLTAPTGVAACNIKGMTIHSWSGVGLGTEPIDKLVRKLEGQSRNPESAKHRCVCGSVSV